MVLNIKYQTYDVRTEEWGVRSEMGDPHCIDDGSRPVHRIQPSEVTPKLALPWYQRREVAFPLARHPLEVEGMRRLLVVHRTIPPHHPPLLLETKFDSGNGETASTTSF